MSHVVVQGALGGAVANGETLTIGYPTGYSAGNFLVGTDHKMIVGQSPVEQPSGMTLSFGATSVTVTNASGSTWPAGSPYFFQFDLSGVENPVTANGRVLYTPGALAVVDLGSPITADADGICASQAITAAGGGTINGALATSGVANLGLTGRNVVAAWTGTAVMTVTGKDYHGNTVVESSASGTSLTGKKAFKTVTSVTVSADVTGATVGTGDVLGLPVRVGNAGLLLKELQDNAAATAGTLVAGLAVNTPSTATTADVRGTYDPNAACDGAKGFRLIFALLDPKNIGEAQYAG